MARTPTDSLESADLPRIPLRRNPTGQTLMLTTFALLALGVVMVHSAVASVARPGVWYTRLDVRHTIFAGAAVVVLLTVWLLDYRKLAGRGRVPVLPAVALAGALLAGALVFVPGLGHSVGGYYRWLRIGPAKYSMGFQPSELIKLALTVFLAAWLSRETTQVRSFWRTFLPAVAVIALCVGLIVTQDFGTAVIVAASAGVALLLAGVPLRYLAGLAVPAAGAFYLFIIRSEYRMARISAMLDPWARANPSSYQPRQSLLAVVTGGYTGKGVGRGMLKLGFLPEAPTDFIFSVYCEEWGLIGAALLMGLLLVWIWHARRASARAGDRFGMLLAGTLGFTVAVQAVLHIAVDLVAVPPTGMSMPFISAGGTALVLMAATAGLMISVTARARARAG